jgi:hypothetical protein
MEASTARAESIAQPSHQTMKYRSCTEQGIELLLARAGQFRPQTRSRGTEFLAAETEGQESTQETIKCRQRPGALK